MEILFDALFRVVFRLLLDFYASTLEEFGVPRWAGVTCTIALVCGVALAAYYFAVKPRSASNQQKRKGDA